MGQWGQGDLVCPRDQRGLAPLGAWLACSAGHRYPVVAGIPVVLIDEIDPTLWVARASLDAAMAAVEAGRADDPDAIFAETIGCPDDVRSSLAAERIDPDTIDPVAQYMVVATCGMLYRSMRFHLRTYPIPELRLPPGNGRRLLDMGCGWGRWSIAAARQGYDVVGIDPSLGAALAAARIARRLGQRARFVVADARHLPFPDRTFDTVFSYSVLQHFAREDAERAFAEAGRVLREDGRSLIQMANRFGVRSLQHQFRRGFREARDFEVRYWSPSALRRSFELQIGPSAMSVDGFFGLGLQPADLPLMSWPKRLLIRTSEALRAASGVLPWLVNLADSLYVTSIPSPDRSLVLARPGSPARAAAASRRSASPRAAESDVRRDDAARPASGDR